MSESQKKISQSPYFQDRAFRLPIPNRPENEKKKQKKNVLLLSFAREANTLCSRKVFTGGLVSMIWRPASKQAFEILEIRVPLLCRFNFLFLLNLFLSEVK